MRGSSRFISPRRQQARAVIERDGEQVILQYNIVVGGRLQSRCGQLAQAGGSGGRGRRDGVRVPTQAGHAGCEADGHGSGVGGESFGARDGYDIRLYTGAGAVCHLHRCGRVQWQCNSLLPWTGLRVVQHDGVRVLGSAHHLTLGLIQQRAGRPRCAASQLRYDRADRLIHDGVASGESHRVIVRYMLQLRTRNGCSTEHKQTKRGTL